jgi:hypothetical protein
VTQIGRRLRPTSTSGASRSSAAFDHPARLIDASWRTGSRDRLALGSAMIIRHWKARATRDGARAYVHFFRGTLSPALDRIDGHRGALVTTCASGADVEITVLTFWESMDAIARFAGANLELAVVEPEAIAVLSSFDERVSHQEIAIDTLRR